MVNNKAALCNCPRQCRHLLYRHDISQAMLSDHVVKSSMKMLRTNLTVDEFRNDFCLVEVVFFLQLGLTIDFSSTHIQIGVLTVLGQL